MARAVPDPYLGMPEPYNKFGLTVPSADMSEAIERLPEFD